MDGLATLTNPKQFLVAFLDRGYLDFVDVLIYDVMVWQVIPDAPIWSGRLLARSWHWVWPSLQHRQL